ncbi:hypothetical protein MJG53_011889 [Ovis ammon polii x Ovis aries]|uniref:R-spondin Fu-CRD domain-containing protein n=2 Tax=Ovis TaxID=9935 RepID=A0AAD4Y5E4_OVIAM|nr:hypothetical protein MG293_011778 [Ovis ammon polii]KAI4562563.1 hypothetical protein MJT46_011525 [Ovis ammon polii x Ovis aries]KAI4575686.1 hypothetical protein MJG53_011889 [Ovis ammon polii x Ovis aries]
MRAPLCLLLLVAHAVDMLPLNRRKKQEENGCSTCQQRLFLFIRREGIRQYGKCVHDCPPGYFGVRGQEVNRCKKRNPNRKKGQRERRPRKDRKLDGRGDGRPRPAPA